MLTPLFLVAGTFFPIDKLPELGAGPRATSTRSTTASSSSAHAAFGFERLGRRRARSRVLVAFGFVMWRVAIHAMERKLID